ncbi:MAG: hypothetical protein EHM41_04050 [Chloroflexi bacterium]|nr:MAG: hypothetical protein EHM41_04050 [Chloroflexota bacterium]
MDISNDRYHAWVALLAAITLNEDENPGTVENPLFSTIHTASRIPLPNLREQMAFHMPLLSLVFAFITFALVR